MRDQVDALAHHGPVSLPALPLLPDSLLLKDLLVLTLELLLGLERTVRVGRRGVKTALVLEPPGRLLPLLVHELLLDGRQFSPLEDGHVWYPAEVSAGGRRR